MGAFGRSGVEGEAGAPAPRAGRSAGSTRVMLPTPPRLKEGDGPHSADVRASRSSDRRGASARPAPHPAACRWKAEKSQTRGHARWVAKSARRSPGPGGCAAARIMGQRPGRGSRRPRPVIQGPDRSSNAPPSTREAAIAHGLPRPGQRPMAARQAPRAPVFFGIGAVSGFARSP